MYVYFKSLFRITIVKHPRTIIWTGCCIRTTLLLIYTILTVARGLVHCINTPTVVPGYNIHTNCRNLPQKCTLNYSGPTLWTLQINFFIPYYFININIKLFTHKYRSSILITHTAIPSASISSAALFAAGGALGLAAMPPEPMAEAADTCWLGTCGTAGWFCPSIPPTDREGA